MVGSHQLINFTNDDRCGMDATGRAEGGQDCQWAKTGKKLRVSSPSPSMGLLNVASVHQLLESFADPGGRIV
jgi:hypothetical protein